jgi:hypothetical protein
MVFAPRSRLDSEREVVLEEIAMYEDTPQELVHDLFSEAVFGRHALGRPVIGTADVISPSRSASCRRTTGRCTPAATSSSPRRGTSSTNKLVRHAATRQASSARRPAAHACGGRW